MYIVGTHTARLPRPPTSPSTARLKQRKWGQLSTMGSRLYSVHDRAGIISPARHTAHRAAPTHTPSLYTAARIKSSQPYLFAFRGVAVAVAVAVAVVVASQAARAANMRRAMGSSSQILRTILSTEQS